YGAADPVTFSLLEPIWRPVLGKTDLAALDALFACLIWIFDGDDAAFDVAAREYRAIIGLFVADTDDSADEAPSRGELDRDDSDGAGQFQGAGGSVQFGKADCDVLTVGSLAEALEQVTAIAWIN